MTVPRPRHDEVEELRARLAVAEETLRAIRGGEVDAVIMGATVGQERLFTLSNVDRPYRNFVEGMSDGAATVSEDGIVLYANQALATLAATTCQRIVGQPVDRLVPETSRSRLAGVVGPGSSSPPRTRRSRSWWARRC